MPAVALFFPENLRGYVGCDREVRDDVRVGRLDQLEDRVRKVRALGDLAGFLKAGVDDPGCAIRCRDLHRQAISRVLDIVLVEPEDAEGH